MDYDFATCNVVYVDRAAQEDSLVKRPEKPATLVDGLPDTFTNSLSHTLEGNLQLLLKTFSEVHVCTSGKSCKAKLSELSRTSLEPLTPTLVLIDIPFEDQQDQPIRHANRTPSPSTRLQVDGTGDTAQDPENVYGLRLLQWVASRALSNLIVPVAVMAFAEDNSSGSSTNSLANQKPSSHGKRISPTMESTSELGAEPITLDLVRTRKYIDVGAVDVMTSPLSHDKGSSLSMHAYKARKDTSRGLQAQGDTKRGRTVSWVGVDDTSPAFQYIQVMVSKLMGSICNVEEEQHVPTEFSNDIPASRCDKIALKIGEWDFSAHDFTDDELLYGAVLMLQHALTMPNLTKWQISKENLISFLEASRSAYNDFVPYHNFRHVIDVLQATFHFLLSIKCLPPYPSGAGSRPEDSSSPIASLIGPFEALTLLITAIGHDVGHPGVNNGFLVVLNAPLAQLYNDSSVLESFHCAAYSQILRRHWPSVFESREMRMLMISSILATDMSLHWEYIRKLGSLQERLRDNGNTIDGWNGKTTLADRALACSLLIKCADISNVARSFDIAAKWTDLLTEEFTKQAEMEKQRSIATQLYATPSRDIKKLGDGQVGFMSFTAMPLFEGVANVMPGMQYCVNVLQRNIAAWKQLVEDEEQRQNRPGPKKPDGMLSPRTMSLAATSDPGLGNYGPMRDISTATFTDGSPSPAYGSTTPPGRKKAKAGGSYALDASPTSNSTLKIGEIPEEVPRVVTPSGLAKPPRNKGDEVSYGPDMPPEFYKIGGPGNPAGNFHGSIAKAPEILKEKPHPYTTAAMSPDIEGTSIDSTRSQDGSRNGPSETSGGTLSTPSTGKESEENANERKSATSTVKSLRKKTSRYITASVKKYFKRDRDDEHPPTPDRK